MTDDDFVSVFLDIRARSMEIFAKTGFNPFPVLAELLVRRRPALDRRLRFDGCAFLQQRLVLDAEFGKVFVDDGCGFLRTRHRGGDEAIEANAQLAQTTSGQIQLLAT